MIDLYCEKKSQADSLSKEVKDLANKIKEAMSQSGMETCNTGNNRVKCGTVVKSTLDDVKAIQIIKNTLPEDVVSRVVKSKEYVDEVAFKDAAYEDLLEPSILEGCVTNETSYKLTILKK